MAPPPLLALQGATLTLGSRPLLEGADMAVGAGERLCVVGRNGSGKSTLLKIAAGLIEADGGTRFAQPGATVRYLPQEPDLSGFPTVRAYVEAGLDDEVLYRADVLLADVGMTGEESPASLSGGEARRAALARVLAAEPDILLLDEPTNHLDLPAIEWLEGELKGLRSALVLISHDRRFLQALSRRTLWLDRGRTRLLDQGFAAFEAWRDTVLEAEELAQHKLDRQIESEEHWLRYGVTARRKRNQNRLGRLQGLRTDRREHRRVQGDVKLVAGEAQTSGKVVIEAKNLTKAYGARPIVANFSTRILRGDRLGVVGANGAGKTTLINLLTGTLAPDAGSVRLGTNLDMATLDQRRASLDPATTLKDALTGGGSDFVEINGARKHVVGYMKDFLFGPEQARTPLSRLSGGERGRLMLARALALPSNLLVLDEPTNDLDLETLDLLQELLADYPGTIVLISHDRDFLDRVVSSVLVAEGEGRWVDYAGGYSDMLAQRGAGVAARVIGAADMSSAPVGAQAAAPAAAAKKSRLSFRDKHALETLPARIADLETTKARLQATLADATLFARDPQRFATTSATLSETEAALSAAEDLWLDLETRRDALER